MARTGSWPKAMMSLSDVCACACVLLFCEVTCVSW
jgi:hypothetical protein